MEYISHKEICPSGEQIAVVSSFQCKIKKTRPEIIDPGSFSGFSSFPVAILVFPELLQWPRNCSHGFHFFPFALLK